MKIEKSVDEPISILEDHDWAMTGNKKMNGGTRDRIIEYENRVKNLESSLQRAREESFQAGFEEGKEIGIKEIRVQIDNLSKEFVSATGSLDDQYRQTLQKLGKPLVRLSIKIAEKIIGQELKHADVYDAVVKRQIGKLLSEVTDQNKITIYLNPKQISNIARVETREQKRLTGAVSFAAKEDLKPGECVVETEDYILEGLITRQLQNIENKMLSQETIE
ncbi:MAG: hypothetical protein GXO91_05035 [FCB group bacterium]|nr:hypothetical protein [FCB group bacterium]